MSDERDPYQIPARDYLVPPKSNGFKGFLQSPLAVFLLGQAILLGLAIGSTFWRVSSLIEWRGKTEAVLERMDNQGTNHSHWVDEQQGKDIVVLQSQMDKVREDSAQFAVMKSEHARLTKDVEKLKDDEEQRNKR